MSTANNMRYVHTLQMQIGGTRLSIDDSPLGLSIHKIFIFEIYLLLI